MKISGAIRSIGGIIGLIALCTTLAGCWATSMPEGDPASGCRTTTYGVAIASSSSTSCPPATNTPPPPTSAPALPSPAL